MVATTAVEATEAVTAAITAVIVNLNAVTAKSVIRIAAAIHLLAQGGTSVRVPQV